MWPGNALVFIAHEEVICLFPNQFPDLNERRVGAGRVDVTLSFWLPSDYAKESVVSKVWRGPLRKIECIRHPIKEVFGPSALLTRRWTFDFSEHCHQGRTIPRPTRGCIGIDALHIMFLLLLEKLMLLRPFLKRTMKGSGAILSSTCPAESEGYMNLICMTTVNLDTFTGWRAVGRVSNCICHMDPGFRLSEWDSVHVRLVDWQRLGARERISSSRESCWRWPTAVPIGRAPEWHDWSQTNSQNVLVSV